MSVIQLHEMFLTGLCTVVTDEARVIPVLDQRSMWMLHPAPAVAAAAGIT